jgi:hypothetical protein
MANHCYNSASIEGSEQMLNLFEQRLNEAKKENRALFHPTFYQVLGQETTEQDVYFEFGSRWFEATWERQSPTTGVFSGDSAWSPVSEFFRKLSEVYELSIESTYEEECENFGGWYDCVNGEITRDATTSYYAFRYMEEGDYYIQNLIEDAQDGYWESADDIDEYLLEAMSDEDKQSLINAINKI